MVTVSQVANVLMPWLGSGMLRLFRSESDQITRLLNSPREQSDLSALREKLAVYLYGHVKRATDGHMIVLPDGGYPIQMRASDFSILADDLMYLLFSDFPVDDEHLNLLKDFSLQHNSLSALRAVYTHYAALQSAEELRALAHIARRMYPEYRLREWLT